VRTLPSGTVTLLFTDIEGSTQLLHELGPKYADVLAEHRRVLREVFARHGGVEVDTQGDAFFVAFATASAASASAADAREALAASPVRVRIGVHTGTPSVADGGYVGADVHLAARIMSAGHGGQILLSGSTRALVAEPVVDLGEHRLKDFDEPVSLYQLGDDAFPPLRTISNTNLPQPASSFVGRGQEVGDVAALVREGARLVTLTGPGGSGKTRLALEAAAELVGTFKSGVFWVGLASVLTPELVLPAIGQIVGARQELAAHIGRRELLLVLDNLEQVIGAAPELVELVEACPNLTLLTTSRERLRVRGETEYEVPPLAEPEAVQLFCARARLSPSQAVEVLCRRLDDMPLALELAAARAKVLTPEQMLERLGQRLDLFRGGRDTEPRQQTLRATIEWSYDLLSPEERSLFRRMGVFVGGCTLEAAEGVCDADLDSLQSLVEKSLLRHTGERFWMLETIREFAVEQLQASGEGDRYRRRHADHFLALAEAAGLSVEAVEREEPQRHDAAFAEQDNLRAALDWTLEADPELGLRLAVALEQFWVTIDPSEGVRRYEALLDRVSPSGISPELRARALRAFGGSLQIAGHTPTAQRLFEESAALFRALGNDPAVLHMELRIANSLALDGKTEDARRLFEEGIARARALGSRVLEAQAVGQLGYLEHHAGSLERAFELLARSVELCRAAGFVWFEGGMLDELAGCALELGRLDEAEEYARRSIAVARRIGDTRLLVYALGRLAGAAASRGEPARAGRLWGALEAEEARGTFEIWAGERDSLMRPLGTVQEPAFDRGRDEGRRLALEAAVEEALSS